MSLLGCFYQKKTIRKILIFNKNLMGSALQSLGAKKKKGFQACLDVLASYVNTK